MKTQKISVFGMGYVGCVTAGCLARDGHTVTGVDIDQQKVDAINAGRSPIEEPGLPSLIQEGIDAQRLSASASLPEAVAATDIGLVAVGTPSGADGSVNYEAVKRVCQAIIDELTRHPEKDYLLVLRSTLLPGILENQIRPMLEAMPVRSGRVALCNHPEFLRETTAIQDYDQPPFIVVGAERSDDAQCVFDLYPNSQASRIQTDTRTAALVKYSCNAFHAAKVAFANEIGALAHSFGADGQEVMRIACQDKQLNISPAYLRPGYAFGGSCLPKDVRALTRHAQREALETNLLSSLIPSNESHMRRALRAIEAEGVRQLGLIGLSFKAGTDDLRESPQVILAEWLLGKGYELRIFDPGVSMSRLVGQNRAYVDQHLPHLARLLVEDSNELLDHCKCIILGTNVADDVDLSPFEGLVFDLRVDLVRASQQGAEEIRN